MTPTSVVDLVDGVARRNRARSGARARALRLEKGISGAATARALGVSRTALYQWEQGICQPSDANLIAWNALLDALEAM